MAENVLTLKKRAVAAGMPKKDAMKADRATLEEFLSSGSKSSGKVAKKKSGAKTEKKAAKKTTAKKSEKKSTTKKKSSAKKNSSSKKSQPKGGGDGRHMIGDLDFNETDGWNPREGSPVAAIFKALKKRKGDVDKTTDDLLPNAKDFVSLKTADGTKRTKEGIRNLLRYRVNRTKWEFAKRTGQHSPSESRVEYGTGEYAQRNSKPKSSSKKTNSKKTTSKKSTTAKKSGKKSVKKRK